MTVDEKIKLKAQDAVDLYNRIKKGATPVSNPNLAFLGLQNDIYTATEALKMAREMAKEK